MKSLLYNNFLVRILKCVFPSNFCDCTGANSVFELLNLDIFSS